MKAESTNSDFAVPEQPVGVPETFKEYIELMFDLQVLAFQADITRVSSLMMARENVNRSYPRDWPARGASLDVAPRQQSGEDEGVHEAEHLSRRNARVLPEEAARRFPTATATCSINTVVLFGSGMSDGNVHNNYNVPVIVVGGQALQVKGNRHMKYPKGTPLANLMLGVMDRFGVQSEKFGDSTSEIDLLTL